MVLKNQKWDKLLELLFEYPNQKFTVREISKKTRIPPSSVQRYLGKIRKEGFITKENQAEINPYLKFKKACFIIDKMFQTGLIDYLEKMFAPSAIIVFGSARKGEYDSGSDIDLFIESTKEKRHVDLPKFEKKIGHEIQLFIEKDIKDLPPKLFNNVVNGIKLRGYFKLK